LDTEYLGNNVYTFVDLDLKKESEGPWATEIEKIYTNVVLDHYLAG